MNAELKADLGDALLLVIRAHRNGAFIYLESSSGPEGLRRRPDPHAFPLDAADAETLASINAALSPSRLVLRNDPNVNGAVALWDERPPANPVHLLETDSGRKDRWYCADWGPEFEAEISNYPPPPAPHRIETLSGRIFILGPEGRMVPEEPSRPLTTAIADWFKRVAKWPEGA